MLPCCCSVDNPLTHTHPPPNGHRVSCLVCLVTWQGLDTPVTVTQTFGVQFVSADPSQSTNVNGNLFYRPRSGNPGYLQGSCNMDE